MSAARYDFTIDQGFYWELPLTWKDANSNPIDVTGYTFKLQAKINNATTVLIDLSSTSDIVLGGAAGTIVASMPATATAALDFDIAPYDLEYITPSGKTKKLLTGYINLNKDIAP